MPITIKKSVPLSDLNLDEATMKSAMELIAQGKTPTIKVEPAVKWPVATEEQIGTLEPVKLRDATMLYQPVLGSSPKTKYFVVGASPDVRVAVKYFKQNHALAIRVEGPNLIAHYKALTELGLTGNKDSHLSLHLAMPDEVMARKTVGSILMAIGGMETPMPDLSRVAQ